MGQRARMLLVGLVLMAGGVLVAANVFGTTPEQDRAENPAPPLLRGPDVPPPQALPGWIVFSVAGCQTGAIDLATAQVHVLAASEPCGRGEQRGPGGGTEALPITLGARSVDEGDLAQGLGADEQFLGVVGLDVTSTGLAAVVMATRGSTRLKQVVQIWRESGLERSIELMSIRPESTGAAGDFGLTGRVVRLSPDGRELAITSNPGVSRVMLYDLGSGRTTLLAAQVGLAWSPDGRWFATSDGEQILIYGVSRTEHVYALPVQAESIAWTALSETQ